VYVVATTIAPSDDPVSNGHDVAIDDSSAEPQAKRAKTSHVEEAATLPDIHRLKPQEENRGPAAGLDASVDSSGEPRAKRAKISPGDEAPSLQDNSRSGADHEALPGEEAEVAAMEDGMDGQPSLSRGGEVVSSPERTQADVGEPTGKKEVPLEAEEDRPTIR